MLKIVGEDVILDSDVTYKQNLEIVGSHVSIDKGVYLSTNAIIGSYVHIGPYVTIIGGKSSYFKAEGFNNIMAGARIICGSDRFDGSGLFGAMIPSEFKGRQIIEPIIMEKFSNIGTNAVVMPGSILREGVLLSIGSVLIGDTEAWGVYKGNPAILVKKIDPAKTIKNYNLLLQRGKDEF